MKYEHRCDRHASSLSRSRIFLTLPRASQPLSPPSILGPEPTPTHHPAARITASYVHTEVLVRTSNFCGLPPLLPGRTATGLMTLAINTILCSISHRRFLVNTAGSKLCSSKVHDSGANGRASPYSMLPRRRLAHCVPSSDAFSRRSGGLPNARPTIRVHPVELRPQIAPTPRAAVILAVLMGWSRGYSLSPSSTKASIVACGSFLSIMADHLHYRDGRSTILTASLFRSLLGKIGATFSSPAPTYWSLAPIAESISRSGSPFLDTCMMERKQMA